MQYYDNNPDYGARFKSRTTTGGVGYPGAGYNGFEETTYDGTYFNTLTDDFDTAHYTYDFTLTTTTGGIDVYGDNN